MDDTILKIFGLALNASVYRRASSITSVAIQRFSRVQLRRFNLSPVGKPAISFRRFSVTWHSYPHGYIEPGTVAPNHKPSPPTTHIPIWKSASPSYRWSLVYPLACSYKDALGIT